MVQVVSNMNIKLFTLINNFAGRNLVLDKTMISMSKYLVYVIPIFLLFLWFKKSKKDKDKKDSLAIFTSVLISLFIGWIIGLFYFHPRPFMIGLGKELISHGADSSFPSDHATVMFAIAFALIFLKRYWSSSFFFILSILVSFARIFCGVHFPLDIIGSIIVSLTGTAITFALSKKLDLLFSKVISLYYRIIFVKKNKYYV